MNYEGIDTLKQMHISGQFPIGEQITVNEATYTLRDSTHSFHQALQNQTNCAVVYTTESSNTALAFVWSLHEQQLIPSDVREIECNTLISEDNRIGDSVTIEILNVPSGTTLRGTVDTGATYSSLHADKWEVKGDQVHFICKPLSDNVIRMPLQTQQAIKSPGDDVEYRPVISLDIKINGEVIKDQLFNLSDRAEMDNPILLGQNTLEDGNFIIDPKMNEQYNSGIDWNLVEQQIASVSTAPEHTPNNTSSTLDEDKIRRVYQVLSEADVTFEDLIKTIQSDALRMMENISY